jgi:hypothetical protein
VQRVSKFALKIKKTGLLASLFKFAVKLPFVSDHVNKEK